MDVRIFCPKPGEVEMKLRNTELRYPRDIKNVNYGYKGVRVMPLLYQWVSELQIVPPVEHTCTFLWSRRTGTDPRREGEARDRTIKLVLDFFVELHSFGLLAAHNAFGFVAYTGATDIDLGVDYTARLSEAFLRWLTHPKQIGIKAQRGSNASINPEGYWQKLKKRRRQWRGARAWQGDLYWLTNEHRPALLIKPCHTLVFTRQHIGDLVDQIVRTEKAIAIQGNIIIDSDDKEYKQETFIHHDEYCGDEEVDGGILSSDEDWWNETGWRWSYEN